MSSRQYSVKVMATPGHTKDSIALVMDDRILTGDVLFLDDAGAGRTDLPGGDPGEHWDSMQRLLACQTISSCTRPMSSRPPTIECEKPETPHPNLKPRTKQEYIDYLEGLSSARGLDERCAQGQLRMRA